LVEARHRARTASKSHRRKSGQTSRPAISAKAGPTMSLWRSEQWSAKVPFLRSNQLATWPLERKLAKAVPPRYLRPFPACAVTRRRFPVGASPTRQMLQPEAIGADREVTNWLKPSIIVSRIGDRASVQAATRVNAEQASKRTMCRPTR
jgi:hypothetical protein